MSRFAWIFLAVLACVAPSLAAAAGNVFMVSNIAVDATSDGAAQARDIAIAQGQRIAYQELLHRLTRRADWDRLPSADSVQLADLVLGYEVTEEQSSSTHYLAKITYTFKPAAVRSLLRGAGIGFSETRSRPVLILPVLEQAGQILLFEDPNPWRAAWASYDLADDLVPAILPSSGLEDSRVITAAQAKSASWNDVAALAQKYGADRVIVADAVPQPSGALSVKLDILSASENSPSVMNYTGTDINAEFNQAVEAVLSRLSEGWKAATITDAGVSGTLVASVPFSSLQEWLAIRRKLKQVPTVSDFDLLAISTGGATVQLSFAGTPEQLQITLAQVSLTLTPSGSSWQITDNTQAGSTGSISDTSASAPANSQH